jgi:NADPH2:quinone reductase
MRTIVVTRHGGPEVLRLEDAEAPTPGPGELVVAVAAAGVNFRDIYEREGQGYVTEPPFRLGQEGAGTVTAVGPGVESFAEGDRVAWATADGSYAQQVVVSATAAVPVPAGVDLSVAAALMLQGMTAHYLACSTYPVQAGDVAVVHAAAGGVGLLLTQLVKQRGGVVVATTSGADKADLARRAGADTVAGYDDFPAVVAEVTGGRGAAVVYDGVGQATFDASLTALRRRGMMVLYGAASGPVPPLDPQRLNSAGSLYLTRPMLGHYLADRAELEWRAGELLGWVGDGTLDVRIGATYPLADAARAHKDLAARKSTGKLLLLP